MRHYTNEENISIFRKISRSILPINDDEKVFTLEISRVILNHWFYENEPKKLKINKKGNNKEKLWGPDFCYKKTGLSIKNFNLELKI